MSYTTLECFKSTTIQMYPNDMKTQAIRNEVREASLCFLPCKSPSLNLIEHLLPLCHKCQKGRRAMVRVPWRITLRLGNGRWTRKEHHCHSNSHAWTSILREE